jgi:hypothetical protein
MTNEEIHNPQESDIILQKKTGRRIYVDMVRRGNVFCRLVDAQRGLISARMLSVDDWRKLIGQYKGGVELVRVPEYNGDYDGE